MTSSRKDPPDDPRKHDAASRAGEIVQAPDLPRTINGKLVELAVRDVVHGRP